MSDKSSRKNVYKQDGTKLEKLRDEALDLTRSKVVSIIEELAGESDPTITEDTIYNYEKERVNPGRRRIQAYLDYLDMHFHGLSPIEQQEIRDSCEAELFSFRALDYQKGHSGKKSESAATVQGTALPDETPAEVIPMPQVTIASRKERARNEWNTIELISAARHRVDLMSEIPSKVLGFASHEYVVERIAAGCTFRIIVCDPHYIVDEHGLSQFCKYHPYFHSVAEVGRVYQLVLDGMAKLEEKIKEELGYSEPSEVLEVRGWPGEFGIGLLIKDAKTEQDLEAMCRVELRLHKVPATERPNLLLRPVDGPWYQTFVDQFQSYWDACEGNRIDPEEARTLFE